MSKDLLSLRVVTFVVLVQPGDVEQPKPSGLGGIDWALAERQVEWNPCSTPTLLTDRRGKKTQESKFTVSCHGEAWVSLQNVGMRDLGPSTISAWLPTHQTPGD